ncbi:hypothetical protein H4582DRAFT_1334086 [Lactarius indigo]|nr:hypothetical protein H4582DRAFT_1334086 [Lactarius indigo]
MSSSLHLPSTMSRNTDKVRLRRRVPCPSQTANSFCVVLQYSTSRRSRHRAPPRHHKSSPRGGLAHVLVHVPRRTTPPRGARGTWPPYLPNRTAPGAGKITSLRGATAPIPHGSHGSIHFPTNPARAKTSLSRGRLLPRNTVIHRYVETDTILRQATCGDDIFFPSVLWPYVVRHTSSDSPRARPTNKNENKGEDEHD